MRLPEFLLLIGAEHFVEFVLGAGFLKRRDSSHHNKEDYSGRKKVYGGAIVVEAQKELWGHITLSAGLGVQETGPDIVVISIFAQFSCEAEIGQFYFEIIPQKDIFGF